jgi:hypothetical protein
MATIAPTGKNKLPKALHRKKSRRVKKIKTANGRK